MTKNKRDSSLKVIEMQKDKSNSPGSPVIPIKLPGKKNFQAKDILRIQSQLIRGFIKGEISDSDSKTLSYLCSTYLQNLQLIEFEERIQKLEEAHNE